MAEVTSQPLRREIRTRAGGRCEYCLMLEAFLFAGCEADHIVSRKNGGPTDLNNLALCCARCNRAKGTDIDSIHPASGQFIRLFNPRLDRWHEHFAIKNGQIVGLSPIGQVTASLLRFNTVERVRERLRLKAAGRE